MSYSEKYSNLGQAVAFWKDIPELLFFGKME